MATFRGTVRGSRGEASRLGHNSLAVTCNGWDAGIRVYAHRAEDGSTTFTVYQTAGSNGGDTRLLGTLHGDTLFWTPSTKES